jgi:hypothetical protein
MPQLSSEARRPYGSCKSRTSLTVKPAGFGRIFPPTCKKVRIATSAVDDPRMMVVAGPRQIDSTCRACLAVKTVGDFGYQDSH